MIFATNDQEGGCLGGCTLCTVTLLAQSGSREFCRLDGVCVLQAERGASRGRGGARGVDGGLEGEGTG